MSLYTNEIKSLLDSQIQAVPYTLLTDYLQRNYDISEYSAAEAVYASARARQTVEKDNYIVRNQYVKIDSMTPAKAKAFAVVLQYMPESTHFCPGTTPWVFAFVYNGKLYQVGYMRRGDEFAQSKSLALKPVKKDERENYKRILVVEPNVNLEAINAAGYSIFCTVDEKADYAIKVIKKVTDTEEAWKDVPG